MRILCRFRWQGHWNGHTSNPLVGKVSKDIANQVGQTEPKTSLFKIILFYKTFDILFMDGSFLNQHYQ